MTKLNTSLKVEDIQKMSAEEIWKLLETLQIPLKNIAEKHDELNEKKRNYSLRNPEESYTFSFTKFYYLVMELGKADPDLMKELKEIEAFSNIKDKPMKKDIYPCPECGKMALFACHDGIGEMDEEWFDEYKIACTCCGFSAPVPYEEDQDKAWEAFHNWLIKEGYLD